MTTYPTVCGLLDGDCSATAAQHAAAAQDFVAQIYPGRMLLVLRPGAHLSAADARDLARLGEPDRRLLVAVRDAERPWPPAKFHLAWDPTVRHHPARIARQVETLQDHPAAAACGIAAALWLGPPPVLVDLTAHPVPGLGACLPGTHLYRAALEPRLPGSPYDPDRPARLAAAGAVLAVTPSLPQVLLVHPTTPAEWPAWAADRRLTLAPADCRALRSELLMFLPPLTFGPEPEIAPPTPLRSATPTGL